MTEPTTVPVPVPVPASTVVPPTERDDIPWTAAEIGDDVLMRFRGIGVTFDYRTHELILAAVDDGPKFVAHHGLPCTDERAREIAEGMWNELENDRDEAVSLWIARRGI